MENEYLKSFPCWHGKSLVTPMLYAVCRSYVWLSFCDTSVKLSNLTDYNRVKVELFWLNVGGVKLSYWCSIENIQNVNAQNDDEDWTGWKRWLDNFKYC